MSHHRQQGLVKKPVKICSRERAKARRLTQSLAVMDMAFPQELRSLRAVKRNQLLRDLIAGIDGGESAPDIEAMWLQEAQQRYGELRDGTVKSVPVEEVIKKARSRLER